MANQPQQKHKLLALIRLLFEETDSETGLTTQALINELSCAGIDIERKTIYRNIKVLRESGFDIAQNERNEWFLQSRPFGNSEITMLVDAAQCATFLTDEMTESLICKIKKLAPASLRPQLDERINLANHVKMQNSDVFHNMEAIQKALHAKCKVQFRYFSYSPSKHRDFHREGNEYLETPLAIVYADGFYYLLTYNEHYNDMTPYRIDRMTNVEVSPVRFKLDRNAATWRLEDNVRLSFGVFGCEVEPVTILFDKGYVNTILDKFGYECDLFPQKDDTVKAHIKAPMSPQFFGWLFQLGESIKLLSPRHAVEEYKEYLACVLAMYDD